MSFASHGKSSANPYTSSEARSRCQGCRSAGSNVGSFRRSVSSSSPDSGRQSVSMSGSGRIPALRPSSTPRRWHCWVDCGLACRNTCSFGLRCRSPQSVISVRGMHTSAAWSGSLTRAPGRGRDAARRWPSTIPADLAQAPGQWAGTRSRRPGRHQTKPRRAPQRIVDPRRGLPSVTSASPRRAIRRSPSRWLGHSPDLGNATRSFGRADRDPSAKRNARRYTRSLDAPKWPFPALPLSLGTPCVTEQGNGERPRTVPAWDLVPRRGPGRDDVGRHAGFARIPRPPSAVTSRPLSRWQPPGDMRLGHGRCRLQRAR